MYNPIYPDGYDPDFDYDHEEPDNWDLSDAYSNWDSDRYNQNQGNFPPTIPTKVPDLKEIASVAVATALWNHTTIPLPECVSNRPRRTKGTLEWQSFQYILRHSAKELPVPTSIAQDIRTYLVKMETEILDWISYHLSAIFFRYSDDSDGFLCYYIYNLVWHPNGAINQRETARNLLSSLRLSDMEKFRFLATYCLKDEMEKMPKSLFSNRIMDNVPMDRFPLIYYWNCYFRNELNLASATEIVPSNLTMALHDHVDNWPSKEYFFNLLSPEEQVECAITLISKHRSTYQKLVLMKLNETQRIQVYLNRAARIMINYATADCHNDDILPTWLEIRDLITEDQFVDMYRNLLYLRKDETSKNIWIETPAHLKRFAFNFNDDEFVRTAFHSARPRNFEIQFNLGFLFAILSDADASLKSKIVEEQYFGDLCEEFLSKDNLEFFDRLLRVCFSKNDEFANFKQNFARNSKSVRERCTSYYKNAELKNLNSYLESLMSSSEAISQYKKDLLMSEASIEACSFLVFPMRYGYRLRQIISDGLPAKDLATEFTKKVFSSKNILSRLRNCIKNDCVAMVQDCIDYFLESNQDKRTVKKEIIRDEIFLSQLLKRCDKSEWKKIIRWALEDDQAVEDFKSELYVGGVFDRLLKSCIFKKFERDPARCTLRRRITFKPLNLFLKWYFRCSTGVNTYKLLKIDSWMDMDAITTLLKMETKNDRYFKTVMKWFVGKYKAKQIVKFKYKLFNSTRK